VAAGGTDARVELQRIEQQQLTMKTHTARQPAAKYRAATGDSAPAKTGSGINATYKKPVANKN
jgi:hypothetical protein